MKTTVHKMRLRMREKPSNGASDPTVGDNGGADPMSDAAAAAAVAAARAVLGDVSNNTRSGRTNGKNGEGGTKRSQSTKTRTTRSRSNAASSAVANAPAVEGNEGATTRSRRTRGSVPKEAQAQKEASSSRQAVSRSSSTTGGRVTRSSSRSSSNAASRSTSRSGTRGRKRSKASSDATTAATAATRKSKRTKVSSSSTSSSVSSRPQTRGQGRRSAKVEEAVDSNEPEVETREEDVHPRSLDGDFLVEPDHRLQRASFDGTNHTLGIAAHDDEDRDDVLLVKDYVTDLYQHLYKAEGKTRPTTYMDNQEGINAKMRAILVDWLVEVHMKFRLVPETLYLCVNIIDRYCSETQIRRSKLQLVGVTALLIACKYEEIYPPEVRDCVYITDRAYQRQEVLDMEYEMLDLLKYKITVPTAYPFLQRFLGITNASPLTRYAANYYMERTLQEHDLLEYRPSLVCAAAVVLALNNPDVRVKENEPGRELPGIPKILLEYTGFDEDKILECASLVVEKVEEEPLTASNRQLIAVKRKYDNRKYLHVSTSVENPTVGSIIRSTSNRDEEREE